MSEMLIKPKTAVQKANSSVKYSTSAAALAGLTTVIVNRLLVIPLSVEESTLVMGGLVVIYNYVIAFGVKKLGL